jgi:hypothetical protein
MDIFDLAKCYKENQGCKYILCIVDVFSRNVWAYKMNNKDNTNVFGSFKQYIKVEKYKSTILMSNIDSTSTNSTI